MLLLVRMPHVGTPTNEVILMWVAVSAVVVVLAPRWARPVVLEALAITQRTAGAQLGGPEAELPLLAGAMVGALVIAAHGFFSIMIPRRSRQKSTDAPVLFFVVRDRGQWNRARWRHRAAPTRSIPFEMILLPPCVPCSSV